MPVYYTSQAFQGAEACYPKMEKIAFALLVASRTPSLFPGTPHCHHDRPAHKKDDEQDRCNRTTHSMGNWIRLVWHQILALSNNQSPSTSGLHCRIHLPLQGRRNPHGNMDGPNRWVSHKESGRSRSSSYTPRRRNTKVCSQVIVHSNK